MLLSKPDKKSAMKWSKGHGCFIFRCSLVSKDTPKLFLGLYLIHKRHNLKFKIYIRKNLRPCIHIRSTPAGQPLPNLKSQEVTALNLPYKKMALKKLEGGGGLNSQPPQSVRG